MKRYDTAQDVARDHYAQMVTQGALVRDALAFTGVITTALGFTALELDKTRAHLSPRPASFLNSLDKAATKTAGWGGLVLGAAAIASAVVATLGIRRARHHLEALGPQTVELPMPDMQQATPVQHEKLSELMAHMAVPANGMARRFR